MRTFTSIDLQKQTGDVQRAAAVDGAVITSHGKPRNVMVSVEEFRRLKAAAGEDLPEEISQDTVTVLRPVRDPLAYSGDDFVAEARRMARDALAGRDQIAIDAELAALRKRFRP